MSPFVRSSLCLFASAVPALSLICTIPARTATAEVVAPPAVVAPASAFTTQPPTNYVFLDTSDVIASSRQADSAAVSALPEAPQPSFASMPMANSSFADRTTGGTTPKYALTVPSGWSAQPLSAGDKVVIGLRNLASPISLVGVILSAGYSHITDGQPNYGVDGTAFAKRFGAGEARSASQDIFTNSVLAPILHEDPRYYVLGSNAGFVHRAVYAATRPFITRTDSGRNTVNAAMLIGYAGAAALTPTYYPADNRNFNDVASTYGASLGGAALGFAFTEFSDQLFKALHMKH